MSHTSVLVRSLTNIEFQEASTPTAGPDEVLVRSTIVGICGSDMHAASGHHPFMPLPYQPGHEVVGVVEEVGAGVDPELRGKRVVIEPNIGCGSCEQCLAGEYNICDELKVFGCQTPGGMTTAGFTIPAERTIPLPDDMSDLWAALIEPFATPLHAIRRAGRLEGKRVLVFGAGPIGQFAALAARNAGATKIVVADILETKRDRAMRLGADATIDPRDADAKEQILSELGGRAHIVFDCVSLESTVALGISVLQKGGAHQIIGVPAGTIPVPLDLVQDWEITLHGNLMYVREDMLKAIELLRTQPFDLDEMVTAVFGIDEAPAAFAAAGDPEQMKVLISIAQ